MRPIEVTKETFMSLFKSDTLVKVETKELAEFTSYYDEYLNQKGTIINNFVSGTLQYFLNDINE